MPVIASRESTRALPHYLPPASAKMALVTLNVGGWARNGRIRWPRSHTVNQTLRIFRAMGSSSALYRPYGYRNQFTWEYARDTGEPTLVMMQGVPLFLLPVFEQYVAWLASALKQDCIAMEARWDEGELRHCVQKLYGPAAEKWGPFDSSKFIQL